MARADIRQTIKPTRVTHTAGRNHSNVIADYGEALSGLDSLRHKELLRVGLSLVAGVGDIIVLVLSTMLAGLIRYGDLTADPAFTVFGLIGPIYIVITVWTRGFLPVTVHDQVKSVTRSVWCYLLALAAVLALAFTLKASSEISRAVFGIAAVAGLVNLALWRFLLAFWSRRLLGDMAYGEVIIVDGVDAPVDRHSISIDVNALKIAPSLDDPQMLDRIARLLGGLDRVIMACPPEKRMLWAAALRGSNIDFDVYAPELEALGVLALDRTGGQITLKLARGALDLRDRIAKRLLDLMILAMSAPITVPVMLVVAIAVKLDSSGPLFFVQERIGLGNRVFKMFKFRSMRHESSDASGKLSTGRYDDRITKVGRLIRATSLDELPQLLNVLLGDMSIVGPRPHAVGSTAEDSLFWEIDTRYWQRHAAKPGLTGLAQVRGFRGATEVREDLTNRLQSDLEYLVGWTIWRDVRIILSTVAILRHKNAF